MTDTDTTTKTARTANNGDTAPTVRAWAIEQGKASPGRGRLALDVWDAYNNAHPA